MSMDECKSGRYVPRNLGDWSQLKGVDTDVENGPGWVIDKCVACISDPVFEGFGAVLHVDVIVGSVVW
jgi:hypothetical protein